MNRKQLYTAGIGILGVFFFLAVAGSALSGPGRVILCVAGLGAFLWAAVTLFMEWMERSGDTWIYDFKSRLRMPGERPTQLEMLGEDGSIIRTWEMYRKVSAVIGRDYKENRVDIDLGRSQYASMVDIHHAVLNYAGGDWYVEDLGSKNGVLVQKAADGRKYRISPGCPCKLQPGDVIFVGMSRLRLS